MAGTPSNYSQPQQPPPQYPPSPQSPAQQVTQPMQTQQTYPAWIPPKPIKRTKPESKWIWIGVIGIILVIIGGLIAGVGQSLPPPNPYNYYDKSGNFDYRGYQEDYRSWQNSTAGMLSVGKIINSVGAALVGIMLVGIMIDSKIPEEKRKELLLISALLFGLLMIATMIIYMNTLQMYTPSPHYPP